MPLQQALRRALKPRSGRSSTKCPSTSAGTDQDQTSEKTEPSYHRVYEGEVERRSHFTIRCLTSGVDSLTQPDWIQTASVKLTISEDFHVMGQVTNWEIALHRDSECDRAPEPASETIVVPFFPDRFPDRPKPSREILASELFENGDSSKIISGHVPETGVEQTLYNYLEKATIKPYEGQHQPCKGCPKSSAPHAISLISRKDFDAYKDGNSEPALEERLKLHAHCPLYERGYNYTLTDVRHRDLSQHWRAQSNEPKSNGFKEKIAYEIELNWNEVTDPRDTNPNYPFEDDDRMFANLFDKFDGTPGDFSSKQDKIERTITVGKA
ncbi:hypothetical protein I302_105195 [Kwoniella bestiolae CBS 10118]|uniref:Uncharacterized protein n=1 Tax=Kwoniella bestiolae CBS 10118 TaxID=1296100 RepID=A0A1B9FSF7_9TREE|nr:hypothetical protein I302_08483 [Kwoniella bestiolae CBS 10118]OCF21706.1 hypothetical protein I302_08483 [Kwoniella bestiolae CBS 10118]